jgi:hypothetical protein
MKTFPSGNVAETQRAMIVSKQVKSDEEFGATLRFLRDGVGHLTASN